MLQKQALILGFVISGYEFINNQGAYLFILLIEISKYQDTLYPVYGKIIVGPLKHGSV